MVFWGRFVPILRIWAAFLAGTHRMPWKRFLAFNAGGGTARATGIGGAAYLLGDGFLRLGGPACLGSAVAAEAMTLLFTTVLHRQEHRLQREVDRLRGCVGGIAA